MRVGLLSRAQSYQKSAPSRAQCVFFFFVFFSSANRMQDARLSEKQKKRAPLLDKCPKMQNRQTPLPSKKMLSGHFFIGGLGFGDFAIVDIYLIRSQSCTVKSSKCPGGGGSENENGFR